MADGILAIIKGRHGTCSGFCFCVFAPLLKIFDRTFVPKVGSVLRVNSRRPEPPQPVLIGR
ncbi:hypothetical protein NC653_002911 [Populus alba x Populus x berolinensis]|uniref:Uncharacterized protein n=1 Tax=Populus alba x Populus x berolinensis TaxID=444605 RepID=A0AAD6WHE8_9ROSI|nr:hypothetical protein NC653_002911 [Populus alba x Populus x berolinensis]